jgi:GNAT superfamily N-acetyltransferase
VRLELLADCPETLPVLARWHHAEWGHHGPRSVEHMAERLERHLNRDRIPLTVVCFDAERPVATAGLVEHDMETRPELTPWLADVVVDPERRGERIGTRTVEFAVDRARDLGIRRLYLFTPDRETFYARMGWSLVERVCYRDENVAVMRIALD